MVTKIEQYVIDQVRKRSYTMGFRQVAWAAGADLSYGFIAAAE